MRLEWDIAKELANKVKHKLDFSLAEHIIADPLGVVIYDRYDDNEHRYHAIGVVGAMCLLLVHTYPEPDDDGLVRVIGLRRADATERRRYEESSDSL